MFTKCSVINHSVLMFNYIRIYCMNRKIHIHDISHVLISNFIRFWSEKIFFKFIFRCMYLVFINSLLANVIEELQPSAAYSDTEGFLAFLEFVSLANYH